MLLPILLIYNCLVVQTVVRIDRNLTVPMKAESAVARAQVFAGKRVPTTGRQYCKRKPKPKPNLVCSLALTEDHLGESGACSTLYQSGESVGDVHIALAAKSATC